ncbi:MAG: DUF4112 domain-containing protein [Rhodospirillaceae bacterium]|nr:DUF4112 domain-containing protein [Rhodospirillaceae bacterium]
MNAMPAQITLAADPGGQAWFGDATPDEIAALRRLEQLARVLDSAIRIPGTDIRFGVDAVLGLIPGIGDAASTLIGGYLVLEARRLGVPTGDIVRMAGNIAVDALLAAVPIVGDVFDIFWRANDRNIEILRQHLTTRGKIIDGVAVRITDPEGGPR